MSGLTELENRRKYIWDQIKALEAVETKTQEQFQNKGKEMAKLRTEFEKIEFALRNQKPQGPDARLEPLTGEGKREAEKFLENQREKYG